MRNKEKELDIKQRKEKYSKDNKLMKRWNYVTSNIEPDICLCCGKSFFSTKPEDFCQDCQKTKV